MMLNVGSKVINTQNNIIAKIISIVDQKAWVEEHGGGDHVFDTVNLQIIISAEKKSIKTVSDRHHSVMLVNGKIILTNLDDVIQECLDMLNDFLR